MRGKFTEKGIEWEDTKDGKCSPSRIFGVLGFVGLLVVAFGIGFALTRVAKAAPEPRFIPPTELEQAALEGWQSKFQDFQRRYGEEDKKLLQERLRLYALGQEEHKTKGEAHWAYDFQLKKWIAGGVQKLNDKDHPENGWRWVSPDEGVAAQASDPR